MAEFNHIKLYEDFFKKNSKLTDDVSDLLNNLKDFKKILLLTTSNRWIGDKERPKSSDIADIIKSKYPNTSGILDVSKLNIHMCEGNVSRKEGNNCGVKEAILKNFNKNPSKQHRCWASLNNPDDELWKISKELLNSDCVILFASVRWGQTNAVYQKLIERLTWLENRHTSFDESNLLEKISVGLFLTGHNWNGSNVLDVQKNVLKYFGFDVSKNLFYDWQYTEDLNDESLESYVDDAIEFSESLSNV